VTAEKHPRRPPLTEGRWMMIVIVPISGSKLHQQLLAAVFGAPLSFLTSVDAGVILNR
jgi:hypothetical protein